MSIFGTIKSAIFGEHGASAPAPAPATQPAPSAAQAAPAAPAQPAPVAEQPVDVEARLADLSASKGNPDLNYKTSIVDLMKLLDLDPSPENRKALATELGYTGAKDGSAEMNIWLHKAVMDRLDETKG